MQSAETIERSMGYRRPDLIEDTVFVHDRLVGEYDLTEPVIADLLRTEIVKRLAGVDQHGHAQAFREHVGVEPHNRLEHSLGVLRLLREHGANLEEQVAGLLHDLAHGTFSHAIDFLNGSTEHGNYHEQLLRPLFEATEVGEVLERNGISVARAADSELFTLLDRPMPDLCADRIDYVVRDGFTAGIISYEETRELLEGLTVRDRRWVFGSVGQARLFAETMQELNRTTYLGEESAAIQLATKDCLRHALNQGYLTETELFFCTDAEILGRIENELEHDETLDSLRSRMDEASRSEDTALHKSRVVDPLCFAGYGIERLSEAWPEWSATVEHEQGPVEIGGIPARNRV